MNDSEQREWWTLPQAAVWIRTRDLQLVRSLDDEAKAYFSAANGLFPDSVAASFYLLEAFRLGRIVPRGWPRGMRAAQVGAPVSTSFWIDAALCAGDAGIEATHPVQQAIEGLLIDAADVTDHWISPATLLAHGQLTLQRAAGRLEEDRIDWILVHPNVAVTGLNSSGARVPIDKRVFASSTIDHANGAIATSDGRLAWSAVTLELTTAAATNGESPAPAPTPGSPVESSVDDETVKTWMGGKIIERRNRGEPTDLPIMVNTARAEFSDQGLGERRARKIYSTLDKELKGKRGPRGPRISRQNS
jgi:hypothetical protein